MKKLFTIAIFIALALSGSAQILHYDFSAVCESGQTLYYLITDEQEQTVMLTYPCSEENSWFTGDNYYEGFPEPQGEIMLPTIVYHNNLPYSVTAIGDNAFNNCRDLSGTLTIPEGITSIGSRAFRSCGFTSLIIPQSLVVIVSADNGYGTAFVYCSSLDSISVDEENPIFYSENNAIIRRENKTLVVGCKTTTIPDDIETIGRSAFQGTGDGGDLVIPNSVTTIDDYAFYESQFSGTITFSDSLRYIGVKAFSYSHISGSLTIPNSVTEIENYAFSDCSHLTGDLTLSSSLSTINHGAFQHIGCTGTLIIPNSVNYIDELAFYFTNFSELVLGDSISTIGRSAFNNIFSDIHITGVLRLPSSLTEIGSEAFAYTSFDEIHSPNTTPPTLDNNAFYQCNTNTPIHIPFGCTAAYQNAEGWNYFTNFIEDPAPVVPDLYTIGYKDNSSATRTAKLYKNNTLLHSIRVTGRQITPYKIACDNENNIYWLVEYSINSSIQKTEIWKNDELYLSTEGHNGVTIKDLYCLGDTLFYVGNTTTDDGIKVATVWTGNDFTPHWVLGDGVHNSFIYDADVDRNTNIPYYCGYVSDSINKASVWKASQLLYKYEPSDTSQGLSSAYQISVDNGTIYTLGRSDYIYENETFSYTVIWRDNECICSSGAPWDNLSCLYANKGDFYFVFFNHDTYDYTVHLNGYHDALFNQPMDQGSISCITSGFDDIYMVGKSDNHGSIWKNFELLLQHNDCNVITDILAVEATEVNTTFDSGTAGTLTVYPNPANGVLFVETQNFASLLNQTEYRITNLMGQNLLQGHITAETQQINIGKLPAGMYLITIAGETRKFAVK